MASVHLGFISLESSQSPFYPQWLHDLRGRPGGDMLRYYGEQLGTIEMTSTNYRIPPPSMTAQWASSVPDGFIMHIKLFGLFSFGSCDLDALPQSTVPKLKSRVNPVRLSAMNADSVDEVWRCFGLALEPLREQGKLGFIFSQFTPKFTPCAENFKRLRDICARISPSKLAAEFRSPDWGTLSEATQFLDDLGVCTVLTDDNGSFNRNNNFGKLPQLSAGRDVAYCRIHRRPWSSARGLYCEDVTKEDIAASEAVDPATGLCLGDLRPEEISEWARLLNKASGTMRPGGRMFVHFSTVGRNASADNVERLRTALGSLAAPWPLSQPVGRDVDGEAVRTIRWGRRRDTGSKLARSSESEHRHGSAQQSTKQCKPIASVDGASATLGLVPTERRRWARAKVHEDECTVPCSLREVPG